tara:strand:- start:18425 stop:18994 length:570 start_codon:yes stop_codon:yes gene_type:complete
MKEKQANIALSRITGKGKEFLSGNAYGKEVFQELLREVDARPSARVFEISLKGIKATDASFPRESVISLIKMFCGEKAFFLSGFATPDLMDNWDYAAKAKNQAVIVIHDDPREYDVIGPPVNAGTKELLDYVMREGVVTTSKVAKKFNVSPQNASAKMKKLHSLGLVLGTKETAESGGLEFVYHAIRPF